MPLNASRFTSRLLTAITVCALAAGVTLSSASQARASDPASAVVAGLIVWAVAAQKKSRYHKSCTKSRVIARYCENKKTGLYYRC